MKSQNVKIKSSGDDSGVKFTVTGTDDSGKTITEVITGANANGKTAYGTKEFKTITEIKADGAIAGAGVGNGLSSFTWTWMGITKQIHFQMERSQKILTETETLKILVV